MGQSDSLLYSVEVLLLAAEVRSTGLPTWYLKVLRAFWGPWLDSHYSYLFVCKPLATILKPCPCPHHHHQVNISTL